MHTNRPVGISIMKEHMKNTKEHILLASLRLFLEKSFSEVSMNEIIQQSGLSKGAFYHYFDSKDALFRATAEFFFENLVNIEYDKFPANSLRAFCEAYLESMRKLLDIKLPAVKSSAVSGFKLAIETTQKYPEFFNDKRQEQHYYWQAAVTQARLGGEIKTSLPNDAIAALFVNLTNGLILSKAIEQCNEKYFITKLEETIFNLYDLLT